MGGAPSDRPGGPRRPGPARPRLVGAHRRGDRGGAGGVHLGPVPGGVRRPADRHQPHRAASGREGPGCRLPALRGRAAPLQHRSAGVRRRRPGGAAGLHARPRHRPAVGTRAPGHRGLPPPGDDRALRVAAHAEVQAQAGPRPRAAALRAARAGRSPRDARRHRRRRRGGPRVGRPAGAGGGGGAQEPAAGRGGPGRRRAVRRHRPLRRPPARPHHGLRRPRDRLHRHPLPSPRRGRRPARRGPPGRAGVRRPPS